MYDTSKYSGGHIRNTCGSSWVSRAVARPRGPRECGAGGARARNRFRRRRARAPGRPAGPRRPPGRPPGAPALDDAGRLALGGGRRPWSSSPDGRGGLGVAEIAVMEASRVPSITRQAASRPPRTTNERTPRPPTAGASRARAAGATRAPVVHALDLGVRLEPAGDLQRPRRLRLDAQPQRLQAFRQTHALKGEIAGPRCARS